MTTIGLGLGILCSVLTAKEGRGTVVTACPARLPELCDAAASGPRCDHKHAWLSPSHGGGARGTPGLSGLRQSHTGWNELRCCPGSLAPEPRLLPGTEAGRASQRDSGRPAPQEGSQRVESSRTKGASGQTQQAGHRSQGRVTSTHRPRPDRQQGPRPPFSSPEASTAASWKKFTPKTA